ncbi:MAG: sulfite exporter TauE/SafE family protein [Candidatus Magasanikbacteria bacterium]|nr:sulfite exporter TauE/SafE family protein [Candidatus Magasanikbacteria bacterium]
MPEIFIYKFIVEGLNDLTREEKLKATLRSFSNIEKIDTNLEKKLIRIVSSKPLEVKEIQTRLASQGFNIKDVDQSMNAPTEQKKVTVGIDGMTCHSCELTVERKWKKLAGVKKVVVNASTGKAELSFVGSVPSIQELQQTLGDAKYMVHDGLKKSVTVLPAERPSLLKLIGLFALVFFLGSVLSRLGLFKTNFTVSAGISFGAVFIIGLVAASSSCIAVVGGLLLSSAAKFNERYTSARPLARMRPVLLFIFGRILSYALLGGLLGMVGSILTPSPFLTALITIIAALYMFIMGLDMLRIAPTWLKKLMPRMPKGLSNRIMDAEGKEHPVMPLALGAATFFLPCGFTQALQLYALTTGSFLTGASILLAFALGTAPAMLALGFASSSLKGKFGRFFFQFSGALVVVLGLWNIQNGLTIAGYPLSFPSLTGSSEIQAATNSVSDANVTVEGNTQVVKMAVDSSGYNPSHFTIKANMPVRWEVDATNAQGCISVLASRQLKLQKFLTLGKNIIEFTPTEVGEIKFNCSMGMYRGSFTVLPTK